MVACNRDYLVTMFPGLCRRYRNPPSKQTNHQTHAIKENTSPAIAVCGNDIAPSVYAPLGPTWIDDEEEESGLHNAHASAELTFVVAGDADKWLGSALGRLPFGFAKEQQCYQKSFFRHLRADYTNQMTVYAVPKQLATYISATLAKADRVYRIIILSLF